jgi:hypothetical protein
MVDKGGLGQLVRGLMHCPLTLNSVGPRMDLVKRTARLKGPCTPTRTKVGGIQQQRLGLPERLQRLQSEHAPGSTARLLNLTATRILAVVRESTEQVVLL